MHKYENIFMNIQCTTTHLWSSYKSKFATSLNKMQTYANMQNMQWPHEYVSLAFICKQIWVNYAKYVSNKFICKYVKIYTLPDSFTRWVLWSDDQKLSVGNSQSGRTHMLFALCLCKRSLLVSAVFTNWLYLPCLHVTHYSDLPKSQNGQEINLQYSKLIKQWISCSILG